jgi:hypothetical protein
MLVRNKLGEVSAFPRRHVAPPLSFSKYDGFLDRVCFTRGNWGFVHIVPLRNSQMDRQEFISCLAG